MNIEKVRDIIIEKLKPLKPDKIILFGSFATGSQREDSDIDLFLVKDDLNENNSREYTLKARKMLRDVILSNKTNGIDIISASTKFLKNREDYFYKIDILKNGKIWYEQNVS